MFSLIVFLFLRVLHLTHSAPLQPSPSTFLQKSSGYPKETPKIPLVIPIPPELQAQHLAPKVEAYSISTVPVELELSTSNKDLAEVETKNEEHAEVLSVINEVVTGENLPVGDDLFPTVHQLTSEAETLDERPCKDLELDNENDVPGKEAEIFRIEAETLSSSSSEEKTEKSEDSRVDLNKKVVVIKDEDAEVEVEALTPSPSEEIDNDKTFQDERKKQVDIIRNSDAEVEVEAVTPSPSKEITDGFKIPQDYQKKEELINASDAEVEEDAVTPRLEEEGLPNLEETNEGEDEKINKVRNQTDGGIALFESLTGSKAFNAVPNHSAVVSNVEDVRDGNDLQKDVASNLLSTGNFLMQFEILKPVSRYGQPLQSPIDGAVKPATSPVIDSDLSSDGDLIPYLVRQTDYYYYYPTEQ